MTAAHRTLAEQLLLSGVALAAGAVAGMLAVQFGPIFVVAGLCAAAALAVLSSATALLWFVLICALVLVGVSQMYLPGSKYLKYVAPVAACGLLLHLAAAWVRPTSRPVPVTVLPFTGFMVIGLCATVANWEGVAAAAMGLKGYYPLWFLFLALALMSWRPSVIDSLPKAAGWLAILQLPFVIHQVLVLVPLRQGLNEPGLVPVDVVAGTFGGTVIGGGANAVLSLFLITVAACLLGLWRERALKTVPMVAGVLLALAPVFFNGTKVAVLYLPIAFCVVLGADVLRRPLLTLLGMLGVAGLVAGLFLSYTQLTRAPDDWRELVAVTYENQLAGERERSPEFSGLTRWTALTFWFGKHRRAPIAHVLIGHGPGATRVQDTGLDLVDTLAEREYGRRNIGYTGLSALLWEVGVLGVLMMYGILAAGFWQAGRLRDWYAERDPTRAGLARGLRASLVIIAISLAHKDFIVFHIPFQAFLATLLGYLAAQSNLLVGRGEQVRGGREAGA